MATTIAKDLGNVKRQVSMNDEPKNLAHNIPENLKGSAAEVDFPQSRKDEVAQRIRHLVDSNDLTVTAFAERAGIPRARLANALSGVSRISVEDAARVAHAFGVDLDYIFLGDTRGITVQAMRLLGRLSK